MSIRGDGAIDAIWRGRLIRLFLMAFVLRALIPAGFMPDFSTASSGVFKVVVCTASGNKTVTIDAAGKTVPGEQATHQDQPCAFTGIFAAALPVPETDALGAPEFAVSSNFPLLAVTLPPSRAGPPLGSRGPPQLS